MPWLFYQFYSTSFKWNTNCEKSKSKFLLKMTFTKRWSLLQWIISIFCQKKTTYDISSVISTSNFLYYKMNDL